MDWNDKSPHFPHRSIMLTLQSRLRAVKLSPHSTKKALNRHFYLPSNSLHPPGWITGLIWVILAIFTPYAQSQSTLVKTYNYFTNIYATVDKKIHRFSQSFKNLHYLQRKYTTYLWSSLHRVWHPASTFLHLPFSGGDTPSYKFQHIWKKKIPTPQYCKPLLYNHNKILC